jgi:hypothetical protein
MAVTGLRPAPAAPVKAAPEYATLPACRGFVGLLTTVDHKRIGTLYGATAFTFFLVGGIEALMSRSYVDPLSAWLRCRRPTLSTTDMAQPRRRVASARSSIAVVSC